MVVIMAARNTKPPNTPSAIIPPETGDHYFNQTRVCEFLKLTENIISTSHE